MAQSPPPLRCYAIAQDLQRHCREFAAALKSHTDRPTDETVEDVRARLLGLADATYTDELRAVVDLNAEYDRQSLDEFFTGPALHDDGSWDEAAGRERGFARTVACLETAVGQLLEQYRERHDELFDTELAESIDWHADAIGRQIESLAQYPAVKELRRLEGIERLRGARSSSLPAIAQPVKAIGAVGLWEILVACARECRNLFNVVNELVDGFSVGDEQAVAEANAIVATLLGLVENPRLAKRLELIDPDAWRPNSWDLDGFDVATFALHSLRDVVRAIQRDIGAREVDPTRDPYTAARRSDLINLMRELDKAVPDLERESEVHAHLSQLSRKRLPTPPADQSTNDAPAVEPTPEPAATDQPAAGSDNSLPEGTGEERNMKAKTKPAALPPRSQQSIARQQQRTEDAARSEMDEKFYAAADLLSKIPTDEGHLRDWGQRWAIDAHTSVKSIGAENWLDRIAITKASSHGNPFRREAAALLAAAAERSHRKRIPELVADAAAREVLYGLGGVAEQLVSVLNAMASDSPERSNQRQHEPEAAGSAPASPGTTLPQPAAGTAGMKLNGSPAPPSDKSGAMDRAANTTPKRRDRKGIGGTKEVCPGLAEFAMKYQEANPTKTPAEVCAAYRKAKTRWANKNPGKPTTEQLANSIKNFKRKQRNANRHQGNG
jgi:hypothetical protein